MIFIAIDFTIIKDMNNEIVMQNHMCATIILTNIFDNVPFVFPKDYRYLNKIVRVQVSKNFSRA